jgi:hypothetical protein
LTGRAFPGGWARLQILSKGAVKVNSMPVLARSVGRAGRLTRVAAGLGLAVAVLLVAGCGITSVSSSSGSSSSSGLSAFQSCLRQHGVNLPTSRPSAAPSGGFGGGFGGSGGSSTFQKAFQACASKRPSGGGGFGGGFGGGGSGGGFGSALTSFRSCMSSHGEPIPTTRPTATPAAGSSPADRFLNGLNPGNAKVAAALKACESKLPSFLRGSG